MDSQEQRGQAWLQDLLRIGELPSRVNIKTDAEFLADDDHHICWLAIDESDLTPEQVEILTGTGGAVLDSIQYLTNTILNLGLEREEQCAFTVDLAGYREQRFKELQAIAQAAAAQAQATGGEYEIESLSAAERRQVHTILKDYPDLETFSRGQEPDRRLVVRPVQSDD